MTTVRNSRAIAINSRTEGPPGLTHLDVPLGTDTSKPFVTGLEDLTRYVRGTDPPTVPPPGEKPILFKPFYRAYDLGVAFNEDYVEQMYRMDRRDLGFYLYDNNNQPVRDARAQGRQGYQAPGPEATTAAVFAACGYPAPNATATFPVLRVFNVWNSSRKTTKNSPRSMDMKLVYRFHLQGNMLLISSTRKYWKYAISNIRTGLRESVSGSEPFNGLVTSPIS